MSKLKNMLVALLCVACVGAGSAFAACGGGGETSDSTNTSTSSSSSESTGSESTGDTTGADSTGDGTSDTEGGTTETATVTAVTISGDTTVEAESSITLTAAVTMSDGSTYSGDITWSSGDETKATVSGGVVTGVAAGEVTITATAGEKSGTYTITVTAKTEDPTTPTETATEHTNKFVYSELTTATGGGDKTALTQSHFTGNNSFLILTYEDSSNQYRSSNSCFEIKGEGMAVSFIGTGSITVSFASTGGSNTSSFALKDSSGNYLTATSFTGSTSADGKYSVTGTSAVTVTYDIASAGAYILCTNVNSDGRGARISAISMTDNYVEGAHAHTYTAGTNTATCVDSGTITYTCETENYSFTVVTPSTGHDYDEGVITTPATCTTDGVLTYTCSKCDDSTEGHTKTETISATGHTLSYDVTTVPTATEEGSVTITCSSGDINETETLPVLSSIKYTVTSAETSGQSVYSLIFTIDSQTVNVQFTATTVEQEKYITSNAQSMLTIVKGTTTDLTGYIDTNIDYSSLSTLMLEDLDLNTPTEITVAITEDAITLTVTANAASGCYCLIIGTSDNSYYTALYLSIVDGDDYSMTYSVDALVADTTSSYTATYAGTADTASSVTITPSTTSTSAKEKSLYSDTSVKYTNYIQVNQTNYFAITTASNVTNITITAYVSHTNGSSTRTAYIGATCFSTTSYEASVSVDGSKNSSSSEEGRYYLTVLTATGLEGGSTYYIYGGNDSMHVYAVMVSYTVADTSEVISLTTNELTVAAGKTLDVSALFMATDGLTYTYSVEDTSIATVDNSTGVVTGIAEGTCWFAIVGLDTSSGTTVYKEYLFIQITVTAATSA